MIVVAHYNEDLAWLASNRNHTIVYSKSLSPPAEAFQLPNEGRETSTYLHHILVNYSALAKVTLFTQANPSDHVPCVSSMLDTYQECTNFMAFGKPTSETFECPEKHSEIAHDLRAIYEELFSDTFPLRIHYQEGAIFAVTADAIRRHPPQFYEKCMNLCSALEFAPWCFERMWHLIFADPNYERPGELAWLNTFPIDERVVGPMQRSEALALYAILRVVRPTNAVEIGFFEGCSASVICNALEPNCKLTSYDINYHHQAEVLRQQYPNFRMRVCDQRDIALTGKVDFVLIDGAHNLEYNQMLWSSIESKLSMDCIVMVHDTGLWHATCVPEGCKTWPHLKMGSVGEMVGVWHQPDEVLFVHWIVQEYQWAKMDFRTTNCLRHGFTLLQRCNNVIICTT